MAIVSIRQKGTSSSSGSISANSLLAASIRAGELSPPPSVENPSASALRKSPTRLQMSVTPIEQTLSSVKQSFKALKIYQRHTQVNAIAFIEYVIRFVITQNSNESTRSDLRRRRTSLSQTQGLRLAHTEKNGPGRGQSAGKGERRP